MGRLTEAQEQLERALAIKNDFADAHFELGMVYAEQQQADKANTELAALKEEESTENYTELAAKIYETSKPRILAVHATSLYLLHRQGQRHHPSIPPWQHRALRRISQSTLSLTGRWIPHLSGTWPTGASAALQKPGQAAPITGE